MYIRLTQHRIKLQHLDFIFDRELYEMKAYYYKNYKIKNNKSLIIKLSGIPQKVKETLIREYFKMCKMVFRIRSIVQYTWDNYGEESGEKIKELYNENDTFVEMVRIVRECFFNIFEGTDPNQILRSADTNLKIIR